MINYIIQVVFFQVLFLAVYDLFLKKETFFKWNRWYLLLSPFLAFIIPLIKFDSFQRTIPQEFIEQLPTVFLNPQEIIEQMSPIGDSINFLTITFYIGMVLCTVLFLFRLTKIAGLIMSNKVIKKEHYSLVVLKQKQAAFSFFNYIFIHEGILENREAQIIHHELVHCKQKHSIDLLLFELLKIVLWFNPMVYIYQKRIALLHEYISDAHVIQETDKKTYFNKLLSETFNVEHVSFVNQFFKHSLIKKRIAMITKEKSKEVKQLKYLIIIPLLACMFLYNSFDTISSEESTIAKEQPTFKNLNNNLVGAGQLTKSIDTLYFPFSVVEEVPVFPGCKGTKEDLKNCFIERIQIEVTKNFNSNLVNQLGLDPGTQTIYVLFKIDNEGNIKDVMARAPHKDLQAEAIRVVYSLPKMKPGKHKGDFVGIKYHLPIALIVEGTDAEIASANKRKNEKLEHIKLLGEINMLKVQILQELQSQGKKERVVLVQKKQAQEQKLKLQELEQTKLRLKKQLKDTQTN